MKKRQKNEESGNWMDTYGDLVTLLMTFFVMLYSMSNLNEQKWEVFVKSIYPASVDEVSNQVVVDGPIGEQGGAPDAEQMEPLPMDEAGTDINTLYLKLASDMNTAGIDGVTISRGDGYTFIMFQDKTFFDGESYVLTAQGQATLEVFCNAVAPAQDMLAQVNIMAHTAQGDPGQPNTPRTDRMLSAMRAAEVSIFIQMMDVIAPEKIVSISYGQFRPVDSNDTREGRARNRRVEILMVDEGADIRSLDEYYEEYNAGLDETIITDGLPAGEGTGFEPAEGGPEQTSSMQAETMAQ